MPRNFIYSTLSCNQVYPLWKKLENGMLERVTEVRIAGGANVANKNLITPKGLVTEVTDEQLELLMNDHTFKRQMAGGFLKVETVEANPNKVALDMKPKDISAPITPDDFKDNDGDAQPVDEKPSSLMDKFRK